MKKRVYRVDIRNACSIDGYVCIEATSADEAKAAVERSIGEDPDHWHGFGQYVGYSGFYANHVEEEEDEPEYEVINGKLVRIEY